MKQVFSLTKAQIDDYTRKLFDWAQTESLTPPELCAVLMFTSKFLNEKLKLDVELITKEIYERGRN